MRADAVVSDLFPWRVDRDWETCFELSNAASILWPERLMTDSVELVVFSAAGAIAARHALTLEPGERRRILLADLVAECEGYGGFACFHRFDGAKSSDLGGSHLAERGYVGFRKRGRRLWSYTHGNLNGVASSARETGVHFIHGWTYKAQSYRPQLSFADCRRFELYFTNPTPWARRLGLRLLDFRGEVLDERGTTVQPGGCYLFDIDNSGGRFHMAESMGGLLMWRPTIFKHYESHFDVFHG
jgi:hypothetical protein